MRVAKLSLSQKGMIVIAIPVMLQLLFVFSYSKMLQQAETTARLQYASKEVFNYSDWLGVLVLGTALSCVDYKLTGDNTALEDFKLYLKKIPAELQLLDSVLGNNESERKRFDKLTQLTNSLVALLDNDAKYGGTGSADGRIQSLNLQQIWSLWKSLNGERQELINEYKQHHMLRPEDLPKVQETNSGFVFLGVVSTVFMAFVLFLGFSKGVTQRLSILTENAARLTRRQELNPPVSGHDEISHLDEVFHSTAEALLAAERQKQEFVDMISHDLKTPLAALQGLLALVAGDVYGSLSDSGKERVMYAEQDLIRLIRLINELLDVEKMSAGVLELAPAPVKLSELIKEAVESVRTLADETSIQLIAPATQEEVRADRERLVQVLINLLANAIKYSPASSPIQIVTERAGDKVTVSVTDQGCGIPEKDQDQIFDRFQQVTSRPAQIREGTGLGLAICKAIIEAHGGRIGVRSREGEGSTFWFELPSLPDKGAT